LGEQVVVDDREGELQAADEDGIFHIGLIVAPPCDSGHHQGGGP
jgi:hypothetical protein